MNPEIKRFLKQQSSYVFDPVKWAYEQLHFECDKWQQEGLRDLVEKRFCAWSSCTGGGKSANLAIAGLWFLSTRPFPKVPCTAPSQHQLYDVLWSEYSKWLRRSEMLSHLFKWTQTRIGLRGHEEEWFAVARTSRPRPGDQHAEGLQGFHGEHILFEVDEGSAVDDSIYSAMDGAFTTDGSYGVIASNPTRRRGYFYRQIADPPNSSYAIKFINAYDCKMVTKESIERVIMKYGKESDFYRVKVLGLPPDADSAGLISDEQIIAAHSRVIIPSPLDAVVVSCDPARFGKDYSVIYVRKGLRVLNRTSLKGMDTQQVAMFCVDAIKQNKARRILIDTIGIGAGVADRVREEMRKAKTGVEVIDVNVSEKAIDETQYANKRAEMFWHLRTRLNDICLPFATPLLDEEIVLIDYTAEKKIQIALKDAIKEEIKRMTGDERSPNDSDALALLFYDEVLKSEYVASATYFKVGRKDQGLAMTVPKTPEAIIEQQQIASSMQQMFKATRTVGSRRYAQFRSSETSRFSIN